MICFPTIESDTILISPDSAGLERAYAEAAATLNTGSQRLLAWPPANYASFEARRNATAEGFARWRGPPQNHRPSAETLWTAWWADALGRKHHRIVAESGRIPGEPTGRRAPRLSPPQNRPGAETEPAEEPTRQPPLALLYPEQVVQRTAGGQRHLLGLCACGVVGRLDELAWMGQCCGPCHDRHEEGLVAWQPAGTVPLQGVCISSAWTADGAKLALVDSSDQQCVRIWDTAAGKLLAELRSPDPLTFVLWSPNSHLLGMAVLAAVGAGDGMPVYEGTTLLFPSERGHKLRRAGTPHSAPILAVALSPDGATLATANNPEGFRVMARADTEVRLARPSYAGAWHGLAFSPDGAVLAVVSEPGTVTLWDLQKGTPRTSFRSPLPTPGLAFAPDGRSLALWRDDPFLSTAPSVVWLWDLATRRERACLQGLIGPVRQVVFSADGSLLATRGDDQIVRLWEAASGAELSRLEWFGSAPQCIALAPDGLALRTLHLDRPTPLLSWPLALLLGHTEHKRQERGT
jgi:WD40 repeat protein